MMGHLCCLARMSADAGKLSYCIGVSRSIEHGWWPDAALAHEIEPDPKKILRHKYSNAADSILGGHAGSDFLSACPDIANTLSPGSV